MNSENKSNFSFAEILFVDIFCSLFGEEKRDYLIMHHNVPFRDSEGRRRLHDFVIVTPENKIAIEIEGETYHNPALIGEEKFSDDLLRANAQILQGWLRISYTPRNLSENVEIVKKQLKDLLGETPEFLIYDYKEEDAIVSESITQEYVEEKASREIEDLFIKYPKYKELGLVYMKPLFQKSNPKNEDFVKYVVARGMSYLIEEYEKYINSFTQDELNSFAVFQQKSTAPALKIIESLRGVKLEDLEDFFRTVEINTQVWVEQFEKQPIFLRRTAQSLLALYNGITITSIAESEQTLNHDKIKSSSYKKQLSLARIGFILFNMFCQFLSMKHFGARRAIIGVDEDRNDFLYTILDKDQVQRANLTEVPCPYYEHNNFGSIVFLASLRGSKLRKLLMSDAANFRTKLEFELPVSDESLLDSFQDSTYLCFNHAIINRYFVETEPCEFIINAYNVKTVTLIDASVHGCVEYYFKVKYTDNTLEIGNVYLESNHHCDNKWCPFEKYDLTFVPHAESTRFYSSAILGYPGSQIRNLRCLQGIISACLRDLNVMDVETRDYVKQRVSTKNVENKPRRWTKVVWLPRKKVIYNTRRMNNLKIVKERLNELIPVMVHGHLRLCENPNPKQIELAKEYGLYPPEGFTFVRPHTKHIDKNYLTRYRSRSALMILYAEE